MDLYENAPLWKNAFDPREDGFEKPRSMLSVAYQEFRGRVAMLLQQIQKELPLLTLHDINPRGFTMAHRIRDRRS